MVLPYKAFDGCYVLFDLIFFRKNLIWEPLSIFLANSDIAAVKSTTEGHFQAQQFKKHEKFPSF
jgi:hypothetical protein